MGKTTPLGVSGLAWAAAILLVTQANFAAATVANVYVDDFPGDPTKGRFVMEAEHYAARMQDAGGGWWEVDGASHLFRDGPQAGQPAPNAVPGARGSYMETLAPGFGSIPPIDSSYHGSVMEYRFAVEATGNYRLYARWRGDTIYTDSLYASIWKPDGTLLIGAGPMWFTFHQARSTWIWDNRGIKDSTGVSGVGFPHQAIWTIAQPGIYTLRISQREAESALDVMVFQTAGIAAPSGIGPPESVGGPAPPSLPAPAFDSGWLRCEPSNVWGWESAVTIRHNLDTRLEQLTIKTLFHRKNFLFGRAESYRVGVLMEPRSVLMRGRNAIAFVPGCDATMFHYRVQIWTHRQGGG
jgi:hypothetical protein